MKSYSLNYFKPIIALIAISIFSLHSIKAQLSEKYEGYKENHYKEMRYGLFKPAGYDPAKSYPLIVYLHGSTDTVSRDISWYQDAIQKQNPCFVLTPKCIESDQGWGNTWNEVHSDAMAKTLKLVDSLIASYPIDTNRLYLYGISMGGFGVFSVLAKERGKFAAAYAVCGGSNVKAATQLTQTPLWIFHGEKDDVVPVALSRDVYKEVIKLGGKVVRYTEYLGVKHNSWENAGREKTLSKWLFLQEKGKIKEFPDQVMKLTAKIQSRIVRLDWNKPADRSSQDKEVWYYKLFRDSVLLAEVDGESISWSDQNPKKGVNHIYQLVAVNYFFKESKPSEPVKVEILN